MDQATPASEDPGRLRALGKAAQAQSARGLPPVESWDPPYCGDIGLRIASDGTWFYRGSAIARPALTRLFSTILRRDPERYVLVTPVEKVLVEVEDAPFLAVELAREENAEGPRLLFRTNVDDWVIADADHPLRFERGARGGLKPYVRVRGGLWAKLARPLLYDLVALGEIRTVDGRDAFGVASSGLFFAMGDAADLEDPT